jgi:hypothetical protein
VRKSTPAMTSQDAKVCRLPWGGSCDSSSVWVDQAHRGDHPLVRTRPSAPAASTPTPTSAPKPV